MTYTDHFEVNGKRYVVEHEADWSGEALVLEQRADGVVVRWRLPAEILPLIAFEHAINVLERAKVGTVGTRVVPPEHPFASCARELAGYVVRWCTDFGTLDDHPNETHLKLLEGDRMDWVNAKGATVFATREEAAREAFKLWPAHRNRKKHQLGPAFVRRYRRTR